MLPLNLKTCSWKPGHCPMPAGACPEAGQAWQAPLFGVWEDLPPRGMPGLGNPGTSQVCASPRPLMSDSKGPPGTWLLWGIHRGLGPRIAPSSQGLPRPYSLLSTQAQCSEGLAPCDPEFFKLLSFDQSDISLSLSPVIPYPLQAAVKDAPSWCSGHVESPPLVFWPHVDVPHHRPRFLVLRPHVIPSLMWGRGQRTGCST